MNRWLSILLLFFTALSFNNALAAKKFIDRLPRQSTIVKGFSLSGLEKEMASLPLHHIEGMWRFPADGTEIAIKRHTNSRLETVDPSYSYDIILLFSANRALRPGTVIGYVAPSAKERAYEAKIYTVSKGSTLMMPKNFLLQLNAEDTRIIFEAKKSRFSLNLWRLLPYTFRYSLRRNSNRPSTSGCLRIYPEPDLPFEPIYL